jgi:hypothetical protein
VLFQSGCSVSFFYVIVNSSAEPITVEYQFKPFEEQFQSGGKHQKTISYRYEEPRIKKADQLHKEPYQWNDLPDNRMVRMAEQGKLSVTIQPGEALQIHSDNGYARNKEKGTEYFPIKSLAVTGKQGRLVIEGDLLIQQFGKPDNNIYQIVYQ